MCDDRTAKTQDGCVGPDNDGSRIAGDTGDAAIGDAAQNVGGDSVEGTGAGMEPDRGSTDVDNADISNAGISNTDTGDADDQNDGSRAAHAQPQPGLVWRALPARVRRVWMINEAISSVITLAVCAAAAAICIANGWWHFWQPLILALVAAYAVLELAFQPLQTKYSYAFNRFAIGERDLRLKKGWLFRSTTTIPFNRVQHVDTKQNPVLRRFGLTAVVVHTAVGEHEIEALDTAEATRVVELITARVAAAKEDL